jgi:hypothetical protein
MKTIIVAVIALVLATPAAAQDWAQFNPQTWFQPGCPSCGVHAAIDWVQNADVDGVTRPIVAGWGFECVSGQPVDRVDVFALRGSTGTALAVDLRWQQIPRPDVQAASVVGCPRVTRESGFGVVVLGAIPEGTTALRINVWRGPYFQGTTIPVLVR